MTHRPFCPHAPEQSPSIGTPDPALQSFLDGRQLLPQECADFPHDLINRHIAAGIITAFPGVTTSCQRCGSKELHAYPCGICQNTVRYCRHCIDMGNVSSCQPLLEWSGEPVKWPPAEEPVLQWEGTLSPPQQTASDRLVHAVLHSESLLIHAVCGAGKTEMLFAGIASALQQGKRVCVATPRTDVVLELSPRFRAVFPTTSLSTLYGGSDDRHTQSQLTISTTHQLYRYKNAFDVMIVDEVDAFPYTFDKGLQQAVTKAKKDDAALIYLSATPEAHMLRKVRTGKLQAVTISARYHRHPLPVPYTRWIGNWKHYIEKGRIPAVLKKWLTPRLQKGTPILLFLPDIPMMHALETLLGRWCEHPIASVHAADPERKETVMMMREKKLSILLTTTILERGVTFKGVDVAVIGAEDDVFTESALVQISGRAGRSADQPHGDVVFLHYGKSAAQLGAIHQIKKMNRDALAKNWIDRKRRPK